MSSSPLIAIMPKVDLHVHLDGCLSPVTLIKLASSQNISLPSHEPSLLLPYMQVGENCSSLREYLTKFDFVLPFLQTESALELAAYEAVRHASEHGIRYIEVRFGPQLHRKKGVTVQQAIASVIRGLRNGGAAFGVMARAIAICMRHHPTQMNLEVVEAAAKFLGNGLVAVDLAGDEAGYPVALFREVFARASALGIPATIHAGEAAGAENIEEAINRLGAVRIGHGVRLKQRHDVLQLVVDRRIPLEMCPTSNMQTKAVGSWEAYPIREYIENGIPVTVNTDNPGVSGTNITQEYSLLMEKLGFTLPEIAEVILNGVDAAFLPSEDKAKLRAQFVDEFASLGVLG